MSDTSFDGRGRTAFITGGSGVLGSVMAHALAKARVRVAILSLHAASSANVVESIRADGGEAIGLACDVRERTDLSHTPMGRLGEPEDLVGTLLWLVNPASSFVTGIVVPVDGGFSAYSGV
jgi:NAD(P)-dependent dehydrogenase (short-subunit alcohol dehydrogenase family)